MIKLIVCGKLKEKWEVQGVQEYVKRIQPYEKLVIEEVEDIPAPQKNSKKENDEVKRIEGDKLLKKIKPDEYVILLDLAGKPMDSVSLAHTIDNLHTRGYSKIDFVIGGSLGVSEELIKRADYRWQLSLNTFPHQLCRIIVLEQIYRSFKILHNEPYHK